MIIVAAITAIELPAMTHMQSCSQIPNGQCWNVGVNQFVFENLSDDGKINNDECKIADPFGVILNVFA